MACAQRRRAARARSSSGTWIDEARARWCGRQARRRVGSKTISSRHGDRPMRKVLALLLLATLSLAFAPAPLPRPAKKAKSDLEAMQGDWQMTAETISGRQTKTPVT